jgi:hypothetical protein
VIEDTLETQKQYEFTEWTCASEYWFTQTKRVKLQAEYPNFSIILSVSTSQGRVQPVDFIGSLCVNVNNMGEARIEYDDNANFILASQTVVINGKEYYNVVEENFKSIYSPEMPPFSLLYNVDYGVIQIKMLNDETYSIVQ